MGRLDWISLAIAILIACLPLWYGKVLIGNKLVEYFLRNCLIRQKGLL